METDASNQAIVGILSQYHVVYRCQQLYPIEYHAKTQSTIQHNWPIHNKELFTIVDSYKKWRNGLVGVKLKAYADH